MAIEFIQGKLAEFASGTSRELEKPTGTEGDTLLCYGYSEKPTKAQAISGATEALNSEVKSAYRFGIFWIPWSSAPTKVKLTWSGSESTGNAFALETWRGVDLTTPIDVKGTLGTPANGSSFTAAEITTVTAKAMQIICAANNSGASPKATGFTVRTNYSPGTLSRERAEAGATGTTKVELSFSAVNPAYLNFALRPITEEPTTTPKLALIL